MVERLKPFTIYVYKDVSRQTGLIFFFFRLGNLSLCDLKHERNQKSRLSVKREAGAGIGFCCMGSIFFFNVKNAFFSWFTSAMYFFIRMKCSGAHLSDELHFMQSRQAAIETCISIPDVHGAAWRSDLTFWKVWWCYFLTKDTLIFVQVLYPGVTS